MIPVNRTSKLVFCGGAILSWLGTLSSYAEPLQVFGLQIDVREGVLTTSSEIYLDFKTLPCVSVIPQAVRVDPESQLIDFSFAVNLIELSPQPPCPYGELYTVPLGRTYVEGNYDIRLYNETRNLGSNYFQRDNMVGSFEVDIVEPSRSRNPETPAEGSTQSGIGLVRGWACDARSVIVQFDDLPPLLMAYGTSRADTLGVCGDEDNGYGTVFAWGSLGEGTHTMTTSIDGIVVAQVEFEVSGLESAFVEGLSAEYELGNFPYLDESVVVRWSQPDQNFIIVEHIQ